jgi:two-component system, OmpR family, sensor histidine kinase CiaH
MFESTRLKLTAWYLLIIMLISGLFSIAFYHSSTRELQRVIIRLKTDQQLQGSGLPFTLPLPRPRNLPSLEELEAIQQKSLVTLVIVNGVILVLSGGAGYFLAGRTLKPIKKMIDEQNDFISNASHELRTPLATLSVEMEASLLEKHISDEEARKLIKSNLEEITSLKVLANNLLRLTQVHTLNGQNTASNLSVHEIITGAHKKVAVLANQKHITISIDATDGIIEGSASEITEALVIILDNAIKYSNSNKTIKIATEKSNHQVSILITDQGIGISARDLPHIFERFYRADKSRSQAEGFGLGLSIAKNIIEQHGGTISVTSTVKKGTTFTITFSLKGSVNQPLS